MGSDLSTETAPPGLCQSIKDESDSSVFRAGTAAFLEKASCRLLSRLLVLIVEHLGVTFAY